MVRYTHTIRWLLSANCLSLFDHFWGLLLKGWLNKVFTKNLYCDSLNEHYWLEGASYHVVYISKFMNVTYDSYHAVYINKFMNVTYSYHVVYINKFMNVTYDFLWYSIQNHRFNWLSIWCCRSTETQKICHLETILTLDAKHGPQIRFFLHKMNLEQCFGWLK